VPGNVPLAERLAGRRSAGGAGSRTGGLPGRRLLLAFAALLQRVNGQVEQLADASLGLHGARIERLGRLGLDEAPQP
jgi:hypothetical protein